MEKMESKFSIAFDNNIQITEKVNGVSDGD